MVSHYSTYQHGTIEPFPNAFNIQQFILNRHLQSNPPPLTIEHHQAMLEKAPEDRRADREQRHLEEKNAQTLPVMGMG